MKSAKLGLVLEQDGDKLRFANPVDGVRLPTREERMHTAEAEVQRLRQIIEDREREDTERR